MSHDNYPKGAGLRRIAGPALAYRLSFGGRA